MFRDIIGFHQDELGDWVAELGCLHTQHVRHKPPFQIRPWVVDEIQRESRIGTLLDCKLCERCEFPDQLYLHDKFGRWDSGSIPNGLRTSHKLAKGKWAILKVIHGNVKFELLLNPPVRKALSHGESQVIPPEVPHSVVMSDDGEIELEIWSK